VLVSGRGTNLRALIEAAANPCYPAQLVAVASNRPGCPALEIASGAGIATDIFRSQDFGSDAGARDQAMARWLVGKGTEIVVMAGYDRILSDEFLDAFPNA